jgi:chromatin assembly factor 1 subunit A
VGSAEEMDDFMDDDATDNKRHMITGDLKPISTGLCWEDAKGVSSLANQESYVDLESMKIDFYIRKFNTSPPLVNPL